MDPEVPSLPVFLHGPGCFSFFTSIWHVFHQTFCSPLGLSSSLRCFRGFLRVHLPKRVPYLSSFSSTVLVFTKCRSALLLSFHLPAVGTAHVILFRDLLDACVLSLAPIPGFGSRVTSAHVCFFSPESPSSTSCYFRASAPYAAHSIDLAQRKATARASSSIFFTTCSYGCGSCHSPVPPAPSWGSLQRRGFPSVSPALQCSSLPWRCRWTSAFVR